MISKEIKPSAVESLTGEKPKPKEEIKVDVDTPVEDILDLEEDEESLQKDALDRLFSEDNLEMITDINRETAVTMARADVIADYRRCDILKEFTKSIKKHLVSNKRQGRGEAVKVIHVPAESLGEPMEALTPSDKIWGKK